MTRSHGLRLINTDDLCPGLETSGEVVDIEFRQRADHPELMDTDELYDLLAAEDPKFDKSVANARRELAHVIDGEGAPPTLRSVRLDLGLSQAQLAERLETQQPYIARLEKGAGNIAYNTMRRLSDALSVDMNTLDELLQNTKEMRQ